MFGQQCDRDKDSFTLVVLFKQFVFSTHISGAIFWYFLAGIEKAVGWEH